MIVTQALKKRNSEIAVATLWLLSTVIVNATVYVAFNFSINPFYIPMFPAILPHSIPHNKIPSAHKKAHAPCPLRVS
ncbi:MAG: hypothetical protein HFG70_16770 [Hungatella sp.]|nr:hypothetical protein [Hungatella sp.]